MAPGQLKRLETMTGRSILSLLNLRKVENYFEFHHVFKYLIQTKQGLFHTDFMNPLSDYYE